MKLYNWDVECIVIEHGKEPRSEIAHVQAIDNEHVAKKAAVLKLECWPSKASAVARMALRKEFIKEF